MSWDYVQLKAKNRTLGRLDDSLHSSAVVIEIDVEGPSLEVAKIQSFFK